MRRYAMDIIYQVRFNKAYLNKELQKINDLSDEDQRLLTSLTYGVIKKYEYLKTILVQETDRLKVKRRVEVLLVMALYQFLYFDRIPDYAIIDTTVELTKKVDRHATSFVNALLHRLFTEENILPNLSEKSTAEQFAIQYSMPLWLIKLLIAQYDEEKTLLFLEATSQPAKQFIRFNRLKSEHLLEDYQTIEEVPFSAEYLKGNVAKTTTFQTGEITIQNLSSQCVGYFVNPLKYDKILDMCAAPGGKTTHLSELTDDTAEITALDLYDHRVAQIEENAQRLGINNIRAKAQDALAYESDITFDKVLLDAPCSGIGVLAQKPEIRYNITPEALDELVVLQQQLLEKAWALLKENGELTYSTCTINRKENEKQIIWFLKKYPDAELISERLIFDEMKEGYSGFYMAKIRKR